MSGFNSNLSNLPPGVTDAMIPGNRPEDEVLEFRESIDLDNPDDVDYLYRYAKEAERIVRALEKENDELRRRLVAVKRGGK